MAFRSSLSWHAMGNGGVYFRPWVGENYRTSPLFRVRTLIVGESHYGEELPENYTILCVREQSDGQWTKAFWTHVAVACLGRRPGAEEKREFWNSVAFFNYIQETVGLEARMRPTEDMWKRGEHAFAHVLDNLRPEFVLVLGYALWNYLPPLNGTEGPRVDGAAQDKTWLYPLNSSSSCLAYGIRHPSSGFSGAEWNVHISTAMSMAKDGAIVNPLPNGSA